MGTRSAGKRLERHYGGVQHRAVSFMVPPVYNYAVHRMPYGSAIKAINPSREAAALVTAEGCAKYFVV